MAITRLNNNSITSITALPSAVPTGITVADLWRYAQNLSFSATTDTILTGTWEQPDTNNSANLGTSMSVSSGVFTFPSTGIYSIIFNLETKGPSQGCTYNGGRIQTTTDNSTYAQATANYGNTYHPNGYDSVVSHILFDVTNTSTHKVKFSAFCEFSNNVYGNSNLNQTYAIFTRLGDT